MSVRFSVYQSSHIDAVKRFNERLRAAGEEWCFPENNTSPWLPEEENQEVYEQFFVALDNGEVRGGYVLKWQPFLVKGTIKKVCTLYLPLSEGIIDARFRNVGPGIIRNALKRNPLLFCLGMGGSTRRLPGMLKSLKWHVSDIPFFFFPLNGGRFVENLQLLQESHWKRFAAHAASKSRAADVGIFCLKGIRRVSKNLAVSISFKEVARFDNHCEKLWKRANSEYSLCAERTAAHLNRLHLERSSGNVAFVVHREKECIGFFVARNQEMTNNKYFGCMTVGSIIDAFSFPGYEVDVIWAARSYLDRQKSDVIVCNMQHEVWCSALKAVGFFRGPSNFALALSPELFSQVGGGSSICSAHFMRGDGEGPTNL